MEPQSTKGAGPIGFVVAGGRSLRMGRDKARIAYKGSTLLEHAVGTTRQVAPHVRILCGPHGRYEDLGVPVVRDEVCGAGALGGLYAGLLGASVDGFERMFWLAVDLPLVTPQFLRSLLAELDRGDVVMARTPRGDEPLCAAFRTEPTLAAVRRALLENRLKLTSALDGLLIQRIDSDPGMFININTPGDYDEVAKSAAGGNRQTS